MFEQLGKPLCVGDIALATRDDLYVPGIDQHQPQPALGQHPPQTILIPRGAEPACQSLLGQDHLLDERHREPERPLPAAVRARSHFPTDQAALKWIYLVARSLDPTGRGRARWAMRWKPALNAFAITFEGRIVPSTTN